MDPPPLTAPRAHLTPRPSLPPFLLTAGSPEIMVLPWERHPRPNPTPPSPRPPSGRWPCPPSAGNQSILAADMLAGCPARRSMRGRDGLGLRSTGQQASSSWKKADGGEGAHTTSYHFFSPEFKSTSLSWSNIVWHFRHLRGGGCKVDDVTESGLLQLVAKH